MRRRRPLLILTPGDPDGIGPEITLKALARDPGADILVVGARGPFDRLRAKIETQRCRPGHLWLLPAPERAPPGLNLPGFQSGWSIETAARLILARQADALVTGPISKERLNAGGFSYPGHTEFLARLCRARSVTMMLANERLRISLVTTHVALRDVSAELTRTGIVRAATHTIESLRSWWRIKNPRIAVAALNPHAGEAGLFGQEERRVIAPALNALRRTFRGKAEIDGPLPADTLFAKHILAKPGQGYDAVVCMYHDQGLIPVKLLDFPKTVNITLGLPIVRTSVDHGTGFDIAGKGIADPSSLRSAIQQAVKIVQRR